MMTGLLVLGLIIAALAAIDFAALRWGVDSRYGFFDDDRAPVRGRLVIR
ncbi:MAG TPA: hypothetical protein VFX65_08120 [Candidatus Limnocylindrales bacterium]|nr:hypothetical protein [Candidatus Limnocylindrales bacterium]